MIDGTESDPAPIVANAVRAHRCRVRADVGARGARIVSGVNTAQPRSLVRACGFGPGLPARDPGPEARRGCAMRARRLVSVQKRVRGSCANGESAPGSGANARWLISCRVLLIRHGWPKLICLTRRAR